MEEKEKSEVASEASALQRIIAELSAIDADARRRIVDTVCTFFDLSPGSNGRSTSSGAGVHAEPKRTSPTFQFSQGANQQPLKQFMLEKAPATDVEKVACLAYYLTHMRSTPHFKTKDITELNTEGAQRRFSNTAFAVDNASKMGYLVPSVKGAKQLSAAGERFVAALPDRGAAREEMDRVRPKRNASNKRSQAKPGNH